MNSIELIRHKYRPTVVTTLFIGESAPISGKFFYCENTRLYRELSKALSDSSEIPFLTRFRANGCFLDDLVLEPVNHIKLKSVKRQFYRNSVPDLTKRIAELNPQFIVVIGLGISKWVEEAAQPSFKGQLEKVHFPGRPEHTEKFHEKLRTIKSKLGAR